MRTIAFETTAIALALAMSAAPSAHAQSTDEKAAAEVLFNDARTLMTAGRYGEACPKLEQSQQIDPALGTVGWLAQCYEKLGKTASAWSRYREVASLAQQRGESERQQMAQERATALEPTLSRLTIDASAVQRVTGVQIIRNGNLIVQALWGSAFPVDPGDQVVEVRAPGYETASLRVGVGTAGARQTLTIPPLVQQQTAAGGVPLEGAAPVAAARVEPQSDSTPASPPATEQERGGLPAQAIVGYVLGGAGVVGIGIGIGYLFDKNAKVTARDDACPNLSCDQPGIDRYNSLQSDAKASSTISTVSSISGGVFLTTGIILLVTAPSSHEHSASRVKISPVATRGGGGVWMEASW